jgi:hypothetical protein
MPFFSGATPTPETDPGPAAGTPELNRDRRVFGSDPRQPIGVGPDGKYIYSEGSVARETQRYQSMGEAAAQRGAYQNDYAAANADRNRAIQARNQQVSALGLMQSAATGGQPSQAQILGRSMIDQSLQSQMAAAASSRGGSLAQAAAMRQAQTGADAFRQQGMNQLSALRAQEMAQARGDYFGAATGMRGQDYGAASQATQMAALQAQNEMAQRQLNQQGQQWHEGRRYDVLAGDQQAALQQQAIETNQAQFAAGMAQHRRDRADDMTGAAVGGGATMFTGLAMGSDVRMKNFVGGDAAPVGGATSLGEAAAVQGTPYVGFDIVRDDPYGVDPHAAGMAQRKPTGFGHGMAVAGGAGDLGRALGGLISDEHAKKEAFELGAAYADAQRAGVKMEAPSYARTEQRRNPAAGPAPTPEVKAAEAAHAQRVAAKVQAPVAPVVAGDPARGRLHAVLAHPATQGIAQGVGQVVGGPLFTAGVVAQPRAEGGPIAAGQPYLVGERGPELVVPSQSGHVVPNEAIDLDEQSFDADEYLESKAPGPRSWEELHVTRDTPADQARVKRGYEDKAGRDADAMMAGYQASLGQGPATSDALARAARSMEPAAYTYKPEFVEPGRDPSEVHVGPRSAQKMKKDAVAGTAVDIAPGGLHVLNGQKLLKLNSALIANQQRQIDSLAAAVAKKGRT